MSVASYLKAMPKVELGVQLEGTIQPATLSIIAEQNDVYETLKRFDDWTRLVAAPEYPRLPEIVHMACSWLKHPEDVTRIVYEAGTQLAKQNVRYAEVCVNPAAFPSIEIPYDSFLAIINDGRDRARRAWGIDLAWVFIIPREEPRRSDDLARWASTVGARRGGVVALGVSGDENAQPIGQFERAFHAVEKKEVARVARAGDAQGAEGVMKTLEALHPDRILDARGAADSPETITALLENNVTVVVNLTRAQCQGWVESVAAYPLRRLYHEGVSLALGTDMPTFYHTTLSDEYLKAVEQCSLSLDILDDLALNAVRMSFQPPETKAEMLKTFTQAYSDLRAEHVQPAEAQP